MVQIEAKRILALAEADKSRVELQAEAAAEALRKQGAAEAEVIRQKGQAEIVRTVARRPGRPGLRCLFRGNRLCPLADGERQGLH